MKRLKPRVVQVSHLHDAAKKREVADFRRISITQYGIDESICRPFDLRRREADAIPLLQHLILRHGALLAHVKAGYLLMTSGTTDVQRAEIYLKAAPKFMAECRKNILALREYRSPTAEKQITVVKQQNVAAGNQQIGCLVTQTMPTLTDSQSNVELLTTHVSQICSPPVLIEHQPEPQVDYLRDVFLETPEVKECLATMDRSRRKSTKKSSKRISADKDIYETPLFGPDHGIGA